MRILLLALALTAAAQPDPPRASVEGAVVNQITGAPVARAFVYLMAPNRTPPQPSGGLMPSPQGASAYTGADGRFRFDNLEPGAYSLLVRKSGFVDPLAVGRPALSFVLEPGQTKGGLTLQLTPQAIISGRVLDEFNEPVQGAQVQALLRRTIRGKETWGDARSFVTTNDRGEFRLISLSPGRYVVSVQYQDPLRMIPGAAGGQVQAYAPTYFPKSLDPDTAQPVEAAAGRETSGIEVRLQKEAAFRVRGRVLGKNGEAPAGFFVQVRPRDRAPALGSSGAAMRTGLDGSFELQGVRRGAWMLIAQVQEPGSSLPSVGSAPVEVKDQDVDGVVIRITGGVAVNGSLVLEGAATPPPNWKLFQLMLTPPDGFAYGPMQQGRPREDGTFSLTASLPGKYNLMVNGPTTPGVYLASIQVGETEYLGRELDLSSSLPGPVKVIYRTDGGKLHCKLDLPEGTPSGNARAVLLIPQDPALRQRPFLHFRPVSREPSVDINGLRPGNWLAVAIDNTDYNTLMQSDIPKALIDAAVPLKVEPNGQHELTLKLVPMPAR